MPSTIHSKLIYRALRVWGKSVVPLQAMVRQRKIARSTGAKRLELIADDAWQRGDGLAAAASWRELERLQPGSAAWPLKIARVERERGAFEAAQSTLLDARARGIAGEGIDLALLRDSRMLYRSNAGVAEAEAIVADPAASAENLFHSSFYLMAHNSLESARAGLGRIAAAPHYRHLTRGYLAAIDRIADRRAKGHPDIPGWLSTAQNSVVVREPPSDTLVVGFVLPIGALGLPVNALHAMLSSTGVNALYLYDSRQLHHLAGTDRFGPGYDRMIDGIRAYAAELGVRRVITLGGSATGYTAIRAAMDLDAQGALVFSPAAMMRADANPVLARGAFTYTRLKAEILPMMQDLRPLLAKRKQGPRVDAYYSASNRRDLMHVGHLAGLPDVHLHAIKELRRHDSLTEMAARGYRNLLRTFAGR